MALTVIGGSNFLGRYIIKSLSAQYPEIRLGDMYPFRESVYKLQENLNGKLTKFALSYPASLKYAIQGTSRLIIVDHDYFKQALSKTFYLEKSVQFALDYGITDITWVHPIEFTQISGLEGDPNTLLSNSESKARKLFPELKTLKTNLIFGSHCTSYLLLKALEDLSNKSRVITSRGGSIQFAPVYDEEVLSAFNNLKPGDNVSLEGPEKLTWEAIVGVLASNLGLSKPSHTQLFSTLQNRFASSLAGELFYPSQLQQLNRLLRRYEDFNPTAQAKVKLEEHFKPNNPQPVAPLNWHRIALD